MLAGAANLLPPPDPSPLCKAATDAYVGAMAILPRPVTPKNALADLRDMFSPDRPNRWSILALSITLTAVVIWAFVLDTRPPKKEREIYYIESWMSDRKDSDIIRQQMKDLDKYEASFGKKQVEFQELADKLGIEWRQEEARATTERTAILIVIRKRLADRLAAAEAKEAATRKPAVTAR